MKGALEGPVRRSWSGRGGVLDVALLVVTLPLSLVFGTGVRIRNGLFDLGILPVREAPVPVISVGNLTVGGTGKTPVARWLVETLLERDRRPALVSRGYGEDELQLHRRWNPSVPVVADRDRVRAARAAARQGSDVCVVDDGFQHRRLHRDLDIVLISPRDPFPPRLLPRGPYRETLRALGRADLVLVPCRTADEERTARRLADELSRVGRFPRVFPFTFSSGGWQDVAGDPAPPPEAETVVLTSVARPEGVVALAREAGVEVEEAIGYPDHHVYSEADVEKVMARARGRAIVTTEKDAVKLADFDRELDAVRVITLRAVPSASVRRAVAEALDRVLDNTDRTAASSGDGEP